MMDTYHSGMDVITCSAARVPLARTTNRVGEVHAPIITHSNAQRLPASVAALQHGQGRERSLGG